MNAVAAPIGDTGEAITAVRRAGRTEPEIRGHDYFRAAGGGTILPISASSAGTAPNWHPRLTLIHEGGQERSLSPGPHGRTLMIVCPLIRSAGLKATMASSRVAMLPMFVRSRPSRTRRTISPR